MKVKIPKTPENRYMKCPICGTRMNYVQKEHECYECPKCNHQTYGFVAGELRSGGQRHIKMER